MQVHSRFARPGIATVSPSFEEISVSLGNYLVDKLMSKVITHEHDSLVIFISCK